MLNNSDEEKKLRRYNYKHGSHLTFLIPEPLLKQRTSHGTVRPKKSNRAEKFGKQLTLNMGDKKDKTGDGSTSVNITKQELEEYIERHNSKEQLTLNKELLDRQST